MWTLITILVGAGVTFAAFYLKEEILYGIVGVSGATIFYDAIYKRFKELFTNNNLPKE